MSTIQMPYFWSRKLAEAVAAGQQLAADLKVITELHARVCGFEPATEPAPSVLIETFRRAFCEVLDANPGVQGLLGDHTVDLPPSQMLDVVADIASERTARIEALEAKLDRMSLEVSTWAAALNIPEELLDELDALLADSDED